MHIQYITFTIFGVGQVFLYKHMGIVTNKYFVLLQLFAEKVIPGVAWLIPVFVSLSALGSLHSEYLGMPR